MSINLGQAHYSNPGESLVRGFSTGYGLARQVKGDNEQDEIKAGLQKIQQEAPVEQDFAAARGIVEADKASELAEHDRAASILTDQGTAPRADEIKAVSEQRAALPEVDASIDAAGYEDNQQRAADLAKAQQDLVAQADEQQRAKINEFQPGEEAIKAKYQPALDQLGTGKKYDHFGLRQDTPFTDDQIAKNRAVESDRFLRGHGLKANNLQEYQSEKAGGMALGKAEKEAGTDQQLATIYGQRENYISTQQKAKARPDPSILYDLDRQQITALAKGGRFKEADAFRKQADARGGLQFLSLADAGQGKEAAKLYALFPNGHDIQDIQPIKDKDGNVTAYNMIGLDGKTIPPISRDDLVDGVMAVASPETWAKLELDRRKGEDANTRLLANINARFDLAAQREQERERQRDWRDAGGSRGAKSDKAEKAPKFDDPLAEKALKDYFGEQTTPAQFDLTWKTARANRDLVFTPDGEVIPDGARRIKTLSNALASGAVQPSQRIGDDLKWGNFVEMEGQTFALDDPAVYGQHGLNPTLKPAEIQAQEVAKLQQMAPGVLDARTFDAARSELESARKQADDRKQLLGKAVEEAVAVRNDLKAPADKRIAADRMIAEYEREFNRQQSQWDTYNRAMLMADRNKPSAAQANVAAKPSVTGVASKFAPGNAGVGDRLGAVGRKVSEFVGDDDPEARRKRMRDAVSGVFGN